VSIVVGIKFIIPTLNGLISWDSALVSVITKICSRERASYAGNSLGILIGIYHF